MFIKLAEELKKARKENHFNLQQLSAKTKIDIKFLEAIEAGDFAFLPELYVKAFIKDYARTVGLDEGKIIKKYENFKAGKFEEDEEKPEIIKEEKPKEKKSKEKHPSNWQSKQVPPPVQQYDATIPANIPDDTAAKLKQRNLLIIAAAGAVLIIFFLLYLLFFNTSSDIIISEKPFEEVVEDQKQRFVEEENPTPVQSKDSLNLTIFSSDTSWVRIIFDDKRADEFILFPNSQKSIKTGNNFKITFGKSGVIKLQLNNKPLSFAGKGSSVSYVLIDSSGLQYLKSPPEIN